MQSTWFVVLKNANSIAVDRNASTGENTFVAGDIQMEGRATTVWHNILVYAQTGGKTEYLIAAILRDFPDIKPLCDAYQAKLAAGIVLTLDLPGTSFADRIRAAIAGLTAIDHLPPEQKAAFAAVTTLKNITENIDILAIYKEIHDTMQVSGILTGGIQPLFDVASRMATEPRQALVMQQFSGRLWKLCTKCDEYVNKLPTNANLQGMERVWLDDISAACTVLQKTSATSADDAYEALDLVRGTLRTVPVRLDQQIFLTAKNLPLAALADALADLLARLAEDAPAHATIATARDAILIVKAAIQARVLEHQLWQKVDNKLAALVDLTETATERDGQPTGPLALQFSRIWRETTRIVDTLAKLDPGAAWNVNLQTRAAHVVEELTREVIDINLILDFEAYCDGARDRFVNVDFALKDECDSLTGISAPLHILGI